MPKNFVTNYRGDGNFTPNRALVKIEPEDDGFGEYNNLDYSFNNDYGSMKKSMSMNDIAALREYHDYNVQENDTEDLYHRHRRPTGAPQELSRTKFVSMAEAIYHFQRDTPNRFHSTRPQIFHSQGSFAGGLTRPQSPLLRSKARSRPIHILSQKEKEEIEAEEIRKFKIKANPIPKSVISGPIKLPDIPKKPITRPEPFNLTEMHKKLPGSPNLVPKFKARPAPKHILEKPQVLLKPIVHTTVPQSPKFHYKPLTQNKLNDHKDNIISKKSQTSDKVERHGPVKPVPFSFEKRDEDLKKRKEEKIKRQLEEERRMASQFKAQPLPGGVRKQMSSSLKSGSTSSENKENTNYIKFEARPPLVLYKEPFRPVMNTTQIAKPAPFELTTEKRATERMKFDEQIKKKEEEQEKLRQEIEIEQKKAEEKSIAELRAKLVHHPKPVHVVPFIPEKSVAPVTVPQTPKFVRRLKQK